MSSINDALRKTRQKPGAPGSGFPTAMGAVDPGGGRAWKWPVLVLMGLVALILATWYFWPGEQKPEGPAVAGTPAAAVRPATTPPKAPEPAPAPAPPEPPAAAPAETTAPTAAEPPPTRPEERPEPALPETPRDADLAGKYFQQGLKAMNAGRFQAAAARFAAAIKADSRMTAAYINLGNIRFFEENNTDEAQRLYEAALALDPEEKKVHNNLGVLFMRQGDLARAESHLSAAVDIDPEYVDGWYNLACLAAIRGRNNLAMTHLETAFRLSPAVAVWAAGDDDLAPLRDLPRFEEFLSRGPNSGNEDP